jgi:hypothetical protein
MDVLHAGHAVKVPAFVDEAWQLPLAVSTEPVRVSGRPARSVIRIFGFTLRELVRIDESWRIVTWLVDENSDRAGYRELGIAPGPRGGRRPASVLALAFAWAPLAGRGPVTVPDRPGPDAFLHPRGANRHPAPR